MTLPSTLFLVLLSAILVFGGLHPTHQKGEPMEGRKARTWLPDRQKRSVVSQGNPECQEGNPLGAGYSGKINLTASGRSCQAWSAQEPHQHEFAYLGKHNHCRNPNQDSGGVWCYTTDNDKKWEHCPVPICKSKLLKVLDFSTDNDNEPDSNGEYTSATLEAGPIPESFTICSAMMVKAWTIEFSALGCPKKNKSPNFGTQLTPVVFIG